MLCDHKDRDYNMEIKKAEVLGAIIYMYYNDKILYVYI